MEPSEVSAAPERWALFLDVDGTMLDVAATPDDVIIAPELIQNLARIDKMLAGALALVSGRTIAVLDRMFAPLSLAAAGEHGAELRAASGQPVSRATRRELPRELKLSLSQIAAEQPALVFEEKPSSVVIHYRRAPDLGPEVGRRIRTLLERSGPGLTLFPGKMSWDIRDGTFTKGTALRHLMSADQFSGRIPIFIGDDRTDEDGFDEAERQGGVALAVEGEYQGSRKPAFHAPAHVREWLQRLAARREAAA
jgi:trehalose 6-phosphate phosphatase